MKKREIEDHLEIIEEALKRREFVLMDCPCCKRQTFMWLNYPYFGLTGRKRYICVSCGGKFDQFATLHEIKDE